ncbi:MAG: hypothetical protein IJT61_02920 [Bacteroidales bacterium]|nr:hypothetical protein [Bacteroidales bacterium]
MKKFFLLVLFFIPIAIVGQVLRERTTGVKDFGTERWELMEYELRQYTIVDSSIELQLREILGINQTSEIQSMWKHLMFVEYINDTIKLRIEYQDAPYKLPGLVGFFRIDDWDILFYNKLPTFLKATKKSKTFAYERHLYKIGKDDWVEFPGDNCSHTWNLIYFNNTFLIE